ncbi:MAG: hypothetical protein WKF79_07995 [Nocardioides sp.]
MRERGTARRIALTVPAGLAVVLLLGACSDDGEPDSLPPPSATEAVWNPCDGLIASQVAATFDVEMTMETGTPAEPVCRFTPAGEGDPAVDANYMLFPDGLDAAFESMTGLDPDDVRRVAVAGADDARIVVDFTDEELLVSGFVQNGDLVQTVDVVDPQPYDQARNVRAVRLILGEFAAHAVEARE